ncbi:hypothetical protein ABK040_004541 [Willaertia magna]
MASAQTSNNKNTKFQGYQRQWIENPHFIHNHSIKATELNHNNTNHITVDIDNDTDTNNNIFTILSYNILAQSLMNRQGSLFYCSPKTAKWSTRRENLISEINYYQSDIICLQECDFYEEFFKEKLENQYKTFFEKQFNPEKEYKTMPYGLLIGFKEDLFEFIEYCKVDYRNEILLKHLQENLQENNLQENSLQKNSLENVPELTLLEKNEILCSGNIGQIIVLKKKSNITKDYNNCKDYNNNCDNNEYIIVTNTHLYWRPECNYLRMRQLFILQENVLKLSKKYNCKSIFSCGDYNTSPNDIIYELLTCPKREEITTTHLTNNLINNDNLINDNLINNNLNNNELKEEEEDYLFEKLWNMKRELMEWKFRIINYVKERTIEDYKKNLTSNELEQVIQFENLNQIETENKEENKEIDNKEEENKVLLHPIIDNQLKEELQKRFKNVQFYIRKFLKEFPKMNSIYKLYGLIHLEGHEMMKIHERWSVTEPYYTSFTHHYKSTLDYIFIWNNENCNENNCCKENDCCKEEKNKKKITSEGFGWEMVKSILDIPKPEELKIQTAIPNDIHSSDHVALVAKVYL